MRKATFEDQIRAQFVCKKAYNENDWGKWERNREVRGHLPTLTDGWCNNVFAVMLFESTPYRHIKVKRHDSGKNILWADLQRIKNELFGKQTTWIQVYPAERELVDEANMYWLYEIPENFVNPPRRLRTPDHEGLRDLLVDPS